jgi:DNA-directed RNA polymerase subunit RPC12/RpoP
MKGEAPVSVQEYECVECGRVFEFVEGKPAGPMVPECPACGSRAVREAWSLSTGRLSFSGDCGAQTAGGG